MADALGDGIRQRGRAGLALAGGRTPSEIYRRLSRRPLSWDKVAVTLTDERWAPSNSLESNALLLRCMLFKEAASSAVFVPLKTDTDADPESAARGAEERLGAMGWPLDLVLLGMGEDGHVASLFPGNPELDQGLDAGGHRRCMAVAPGEPAPPQARLSLTLAALLDARCVFLVIRGDDKLQALARARDHADPVRAPVLALLGQNRTPVHILWAP